ncbi:sensor histidine kinase [Bailinhaonella thermotolerans]|uniref:histidine kinase n=1 Tax=Bailinhaonella thermotolerans TaxID=1070861 RepID=A0A3A4AT39_9ACTN|nr:histidine kinase [Bailinhaonella thermotolerans]RJL32513.1 sensor histidine kinase [Bailinhaonella thermotolerans]
MRVIREGVLIAAMGALIVLGTHGAQSQQPSARPFDAPACLLLLVALGGMPLRQRRPFTALGLTVAAALAYTVLGYAYGPFMLASVIPLYTIAVERPARHAVGAALAAWAALMAGRELIERFGDPRDSVFYGLTLLASLLLPVWAGGTVRLRVAYVAEARDRAVQEERARREEAQRRMAEERLMMAREVHDVVAHSLSMISVQAGAALHALERAAGGRNDEAGGRDDETGGRNDEVGAALGAIRAASKDALGDLRATLKGWREVSPGLARLDALVAELESGGVPVSLTREGDLGGLPPDVDRAAFRIVQEALTNVVRHAAGATTRVRLRRTAAELAVEVVNDAPALVGAPGEAPGGAGFGLAGMRERVSALGGSLRTGPREDGGFEVAARLPLAG